MNNQHRAWRRYSIYGILSALLLAVGVWQVYHWQRGTQTLSLYSKVPMSIPRENIIKHVLPNGMTVLIFKDTSVSKVLLQIAYNIGSAHETQGERGLAHLLEHMIFKGTNKLSERDIDAIARKYGASLNAFTMQDITSYYFEVNSKNWKPFVDILADCMKNARFDEQHLASEVKAVIQELRMYKDDYWSTMIEEFSHLLFPSHHPYHMPIIGFKEDLLTISSKRLRDFYHKYYHPNRATLFVVGDVDPDEVIAEVEQQFASIDNGHEKIEPSFPAVASELTTYNVSIYRDVSQPRLGYGFLVPGQECERNEVLGAVEHILGGGEGSRLYKRLVEQDKVATSVAVGTNQMIKSGIFLVLIEPLPGKIDECRRIVQEELERLAREGVSPHELAKVVNTQKRAHFQMLEQFNSLVMSWVQSFFATGDEYYLFDYVNKLQQVTSEDIQSFVGKYLDPFFLNEIRIMPLPPEKQPYAREIRKQEEELDAKILYAHQRTAPVEEPRLAPTLPRPAAVGVQFPKPDDTFTLKNGLRVVVHEREIWPIFSLNIRFRDAAHYTSSKEGIGISLLMDMLFEGSKGYTKDDHVTFFEDRGVSYDFGSTGMTITGLREHFDAIVERLAHIILNPSFQRDALEKLRAIYLDTYLRRQENPQAVGMRMLTSQVFGPEHPYAWNFQEAVDFIQSITLSDIKDWYDRYLAPAQVVMSVSGAVSSKTVHATVERYFAAWNGGSAYQPRHARATKAPAAARIDHEMLRDQVAFYVGRVSQADIYSSDMPALRLLNLIFWSSLGSRVFQLREQTGLFYSATGGWGAGASREKGIDFAYALVSREHLDDVEHKLKSIVADASKNTVSQEELDTARQLYVKALIDAESSNSSIASTLAMLDAYELGFDYYDKTLRLIEAMTVRDINEIAKRYGMVDNFNVVRVGRVK